MKKIVFVFLALLGAKALAADLESGTAQTCPTATELADQKFQLYGMSQDADMLKASRTYLAQAKRCHELQRAQGIRGSKRSLKEKYLRTQASALVTATGTVPLSASTPLVQAKDANQ